MEIDNKTTPSEKGGILDYEIENGILRINKQLDDDYDVSFDRACADLVSSGEKEITFDLSQVKFITSTYIGLMATAFFQAKAHKKNMTIIAQGQVLNVLRMSGFEAFMPLIDKAKQK